MMKPRNTTSWNNYEAGDSCHNSYEERYTNTEADTQMVIIKEEIDIEEETTYIDPYQSNLPPNNFEDEFFPPQVPAVTDSKKMLEAIKEIKYNNESVSTIAARFNIPESTLLSYITEFDAEISEISFLNDEDLLEVIEKITSFSTDQQRFSIKDFDQDEFTTQQEQCMTPYSPSNLCSQFSELERLPPKSNGTTSLNTILQAIKEIRLYGNSVRGTAAALQIPRTSLLRYVRRFDAEVTDIHLLNNDNEIMEVIKGITTPRKVFSTEQEKVLVDHVRSLIERNVKISLTELRTLIYNFACKMNVHYPLSWDKDAMAKINWCNGFRQRNSLISLNSMKTKEPFIQDETCIYHDEVADSPQVSGSPEYSLSSFSPPTEPLQEKNTPNTSFDRLVQAIKAIKMNKLSVRGASQIFKIPPTSLARYVRKFNAAVPNIMCINDEELLRIVKRISLHTKIPEIFTVEQEQELLDHVKYCLYSRNKKLNVSKFRVMVYEFARERNIEYPLKWDKDKMVSRYWCYTFAKRHSFNFDQDNKDNEELITANEILRATLLRKKPTKSKRKRNATLDLKKTKKLYAKNILQKFMTSALSQNKNICVICLKNLPRKLSLKNSILYEECNRIVHMKCARIQQICCIE